MHVLVTGGTGFVGRTLCRHLGLAHRVTVLDSLRHGRARLSHADLAGVALIELDLRKGEQVARAIARIQPDVVIHLAAIHYIPECEADPVSAFTTNVLGAVNLLSALPSGCRIIFISSAAAYQPSPHPHRETDAMVAVPLDVYGISKLHGEAYVQYFARERRLRGVIVRLFNVVGPGETNPHLVPEVVAQVIAGHSEILLGNTSPKRDFVHVEDVARGLCSLATAPDLRDGEVECFNLGSGQAYSVREVVEMIADVSGKEVRIVVDPSRVRVIDRPLLCANTAKLEAAISWKAERTLHDALEDIWRDPEVLPELAERYLR